MKVIAWLSWYMELPSMLSELVDSLGEAGMDYLVAVDGAYGLYRGGTARSTPEEYDAITTAAHHHGMGVTIHTPATPWHGNEIQKKTFVFALAHAHATPYDDWLFAIDADEHIHEHDPHYQDTLATTPHDVGSVMHTEQGVTPSKQRRFYRAHPRGIRVEKAHYYFLNGDNQVLWGPGQIPTQAIDMTLLHKPWDRTKPRRQARNQYYEDRLTTNAEADI